MMKYLLTALLFSLLVVMLSACNDAGTQLPIIGQWESEHTMLRFNADGTGFEKIDNQEFIFEWSTVENILTFTFAEDAGGSLINHFMSFILHGSPVEAFSFSMSDDNRILTISDDHGHGHFMLTFTKVD